jgi:hypothetical protein
MPGRLPSGRISPPLDLLHHRALGIRLRVDGPAPTNGPCAVLNVQLESGGKTYRDHYIDLDFRGEKTIVLPEPTTERCRSFVRHANYEFKAAYGFSSSHHRPLTADAAAQGEPVGVALSGRSPAESEVALKNLSWSWQENFTLPVGEDRDYASSPPPQRCLPQRDRAVL